MAGLVKLMSHYDDVWGQKVRRAGEKKCKESIFITHLYAEHPVADNANEVNC